MEKQYDTKIPIVNITTWNDFLKFAKNAKYVFYEAKRFAGLHRNKIKQIIFYALYMDNNYPIAFIFKKNWNDIIRELKDDEYSFDEIINITHNKLIKLLEYVKFKLNAIPGKIENLDRTSELFMMHI